MGGAHKFPGASPTGAASPKGSGGETKDVPKAYDPKIPPRPAAGAEAESLSGMFAEARQKFDAVMGEQNQRLMEMKIAVMQGMEMAVSRLEDEARRTRTLMERNDALAREAERAVVEGRNLERQQDELEAQVTELTERTLALSERAATLREERTKLETNKAELEQSIEADRTSVTDLKAEVQRLEAQADALQGEKTTLEQKKMQVEERLARLQRLKDEFISETTRAQRALTEMTGMAASEPSEPAPSTPAPRPTSGSNPKPSPKSGSGF